MEILRVLFDSIMRYDPRRPDWPDRDRFILSKGHGCLALYLFLAEKGYFPEHELHTTSFFGSRLGGHPHHGCPGVEAATGALGHGLPIGVGMALAARIDDATYRTFVVVGDGECQEGSIWEAAMCASKHQLDNLVVIVDNNRMQCYGRIEEVQPLEPLADKWRAFGFCVQECDGHDVKALQSHFESLPFQSNRPSLLLAHTVKGMGISACADNADWHHKAKITDDDIATLLAGLEPGT